VVRGRLAGERHRQADVHDVARGPGPADRRVRTRGRGDVLHRTVHADPRTRCPERDAYLQRDGTRAGDGEPAGLRLREGGVLPDRDAAAGPGEHRGDEEVDVERVAGEEVDGVGVLGVALHAGAVVAGEVVVVVAVRLDAAGAQRDVVRDEAVRGVRILLAEHL